MSLSPEEKDRLSRHSVYLEDSVLKDMAVQTARIDSILVKELPDFIKGPEAEGKRVPVLFWTHGGNVRRPDAEREAVTHIPIWRSNGIYPIYFLWDTGAASTVVDAITEWLPRHDDGHAPVGHLEELRPKPWRDWLIGHSARAVNVPDIWQEMKEAAKNSNKPKFLAKGKGGAYVFAERLAAQWAALEDHIELHAVGHSAGAIFHADFIPLLFQNGMALKSLQLLAPAIRIDEYTPFARMMTGKIGSIKMFTMNQQAEERDTILGPDGKGLYKGSLLYFIRDVLEYGTPEGQPGNRALLGLQEDYDRAEPVVTGSFDQVIFTPTSQANPVPGASSQAKSHTAFSRDPDTLNSVATNILGADPRVPFQLQERIAPHDALWRHRTRPWWAHAT